MTPGRPAVERIAHPGPALLLELERLDREAMGETAAGRFTLRALAETGQLFILREGGEIAAVAQYLARLGVPEAAHLFGFFTVERFRGRGLGRTLLRESLARLAGEGIRQVDLTVEPSNVAALGLYRANGFHEIARSADHYGPGATRLVLEARLAPEVSCGRRILGTPTVDSSADGRDISS